MKSLDGQPVEGGIPFSSNGLEECLRRGAAEFGWDKPFERSDPGDTFIKRGRGISIMIYRGGVGDESAARLSIDEAGRINLVSGLIDVGEGAVTVLCQMAAEALSVPYEDVIPRFADTGRHSRRAHYGRLHGHLLHRDCCAAGGGTVAGKIVGNRRRTIGSRPFRPVDCRWRGFRSRRPDPPDHLRRVDSICRVRCSFCRGNGAARQYGLHRQLLRRSLL